MRIGYGWALLVIHCPRESFPDRMMCFLPLKLHLPWWQLQMPQMECSWGNCQTKKPVLFRHGVPKAQKSVRIKAAPAERSSRKPSHIQMRELKGFSITQGTCSMMHRKATSTETSRSWLPSKIFAASWIERFGSPSKAVSSRSGGGPPSSLRARDHVVQGVPIHTKAMREAFFSRNLFKFDLTTGSKRLQPSP